MLLTSVTSRKKRNTTDFLSHQYVTDSLKNKTSVHDANEAHMHHLGDTSDESIQEALNELFKKQSEHIDVQRKSIVETTLSNTQNQRIFWISSVQGPQGHQRY